MAVGTGNLAYGKAFVTVEKVPFPVLIDEDGEAAEAASVEKGTVGQVMGPRNVGGALRAVRAGHRQHRTGEKPMQLGATFVIGPGHRLRYEYHDRTASDHAPVDEVLEALSSG